MFRLSQLPMGLGSLKHILKVEIIRVEQREQNKFDENSSLQYACAVAVLKYVHIVELFRRFFHTNCLRRFVDAVSVPYRAHHSRLSYRNIAKQVKSPFSIFRMV